MKTQILKTYCFGILLLTSSSLAYGMDQATAKKLLKKSRCTTCHDIEKDKIGPSYKEVAARYAKPDKKTSGYMNGKTAADYLFEKIRKGTKKNNRNWVKSKAGKRYGIMTANKASKISDQDLKDLISYILTMK